MARVEVAGVFARLGFAVDESGAQKFEREVKEARAKASRPIVQELQLKIDEKSRDNIEKQLARDQAKFGRQQITRTIRADVDGLRKDLKEAEAAVKSYDDRIENASNKRSASALAHQKKLKQAIVDTKEAELKGALEALTLNKRINEGLELQERNVAAIERAEISRGRAEASLARRREQALKSESRELAKLAREEAKTGRRGPGVVSRIADFSPGLRTSLGPISGDIEKIAVTATALMPIITALAGSVVALASSFAAAAAGAGALGVALGSSLLPLGVVALGVTQRIGKMTEAWQSMKQEEQGATRVAESSADKQEAAADQVRNATDRVKSAKDSLAETERSLTEAQENLTEAQFRARREMEDLRESSDDAVRSQKQAQLSFDEAAVALEKVMADPGSTRLEIRAAKLDLEDARDSVSDAATERKRAREDERRGTTTIRDAQRQLAQAKRAVARANNEVAKANQGVVEAQQAAKKSLEDTSAAADKTAFKLAELTKAERGLLKGMEKFSETFTKVMQPATDAIFTSATKAMTTLTPLLEHFKGRFENLGEGIGGVIEKAARSLAGPEWTKALEKFSDLAERLIEPVSNAFGSILEVLRDIAVAAGPSLEKVADAFEKMFGDLAEKTSNAGKMRDIIKDLVRHTKDWVDFFGEVGELMFNVFLGGKEDGRQLLDVITKIVHRWNNFLESKEGRKRLSDFFDKAVRDTKNIVRFVKGIVEGFKDVFDVVAPFVHVLSRIAGFVTDAFSGKNRDGWESMGHTLGILAVLKFTGAIKMLSLLTKVGAGAAGIKAAFAVLQAGGGIKGAVGAALDVFKGRGSTPANPLFVADVAGGGIPGKGAPVVGGGAAGGVMGMLTKLIKSPTARFAGTGAGATAGFLVLQQLINSQKGGDELNKLTQRLDALASPARTGKNTRGDQLRELAGALEEAIKKGDSKELGNIAGKLEELGKAGKSLTDKEILAIAEAIRKVAKAHKSLPEDVKEVNKNIRDNWRRTRKDVNVDMNDIRKQLTSNMKMIKTRLGTDSLEGTRAVSKNFKEAKRAIRESMRDGVITTRDGMREIRKIMVDELKFYGVSPKMAASIVKHGDWKGEKTDAAAHGDDLRGGQHGGRVGNFRKLAGGGWLGAGRGSIGPDNISLGGGNYAASGEYYAPGRGGGAVINRHQAPFVDMALLMTGGRTLDSRPSLATIENAMGGASRLDALFGAVDRPHMFAKGGRANIPAAIAAANQLEKAHFNYQWGGGHSATPAPFGPMDCSGAVSYVLQHAGVNIPTMASGQMMGIGKSGPGAITVFADAGHVLMRIGKRFFGTSGSNPGGGAGWIDPAPTESYLSRFAVRHFGPGGAPGDFTGVHMMPPHVSVKGGGIIGMAVGGALRAAARGSAFAGNNTINAMGIGTGDGSGGGAWNYNGPLNRTFPKHSLANARGHVQLSEAQAAGLHKNAGLPSVFNMISKRESQNYPGIFGLDPGGTIGEGLHQITFGVQSPSYQRILRSIGNSYNPWKNSLMAKQMYDDSGVGPWAPSGPYKRGGRIGRTLRALGRFASGGFPGSSFIQNTQNTAIGGTTSAYAIGKLKKRNVTRIASYERIVGDIEDLRTRYEIKDRRLGQTVEEFVTPDGDIDQAQINKRVAEIDKLIALRQKIIDKLKKAEEKARKIVQTYRELVKRLRGSLKGRSKKEKKGIKAKIDFWQGQIGEWQDTVKETGFELDRARLDRGDLQIERKEVLGTKSTREAPEKDTGTTETDTAQAEALHQREVEEAYRRGRAEFIDVNTGAIIDQSGPPGLIGLGSGFTSRVAGGPAMPGDVIGGGGAAGGIAPIININTLVPGDSATYNAIGKAATIGQGLQGSISTSRVVTGA